MLPFLKCHVGKPSDSSVTRSQSRTFTCLWTWALLLRPRGGDLISQGNRPLDAAEFNECPPGTIVPLDHVTDFASHREVAPIQCCPCPFQGSALLCHQRPAAALRDRRGV